MVRIPTVTENTVQTQVVQGPRANDAPSGAFGGAIAQGLQSVAAAAQEIQLRAATAEAEEQLSAFDKHTNQLLFNPKTGYFNTNGKNAYSNAGSVTSQLEELKKTYGSSISNPKAREAFDRAAKARLASATNDIMRHSSKGLKAWEVSAANDGIEDSIETGSLYWNNPEKMNLQRQIGRQAVITVADMEGIDASAEAERLQDYEAAFTTTVIESALGRDVATAEELYNKHKNTIESEPARLNIEAKIAARKRELSTASESAFINNKATELVAVYGDLSDARAQAQAEINSEPDGNIRKKLTQEFDYLFRQKQSADAEARGAYFEEGEAALLEGATVEQFKMINPKGWEALSPGQQKKLYDTEKEGAAETDYNVLSEVILKPKNELAKVNPSDYFDNLAPTERKQLINAVKAARTGTDTDEAQVGRSRIAQTSLMVEQLGFKGKPEMANQFYSLVDAEVKSREVMKGSKLTSTEYTDVLNGFAREAVVKGRMFGTSERDLKDILKEIKPIKSDGQVITSQQQLDQITTLLRDNGVTINNQNILRAYRQATKGQ